MPRSRVRAVRFANSTEESFGRLLHRLRLRWEYEPHTFVLRRRPDGTPAMAFTPDFYLPDVGMYFEITTLRQKLVTAKNRKARLLGEQRPDVRLRILYRRDCQELLRPVRGTRRAREALLRKLFPAPPDEALRRAAWLACLPRRADAAGRISVLGVRLHLGPERAGRRVQVWIYPGSLEVDAEGATLARFPCAYDERTRRLRSVEPGELLHSAGVEQAPLALPELEPRPLLGMRRRSAVQGQPHAAQLALPM